MAGMEAVLKARNGACAGNLRIFNIFVIVLMLGIPGIHSQKLYFEENDVSVLVGTTETVKLWQSGQFKESLTMTAAVQHPDLVQIMPTTVNIPSGSAKTSHALTVVGKNLGHSEITFTITPAGYINENSVFLLITVMQSRIIKVISYIMGWMYFLAWSISFYPQIYINYTRKSVVGLNFDFLSLNIVGFVMYSLFNNALYFSKTMQAEYFARHPRGLNPVHLNDVFFSMHAAFATCLTISQCFIYERGNQRVSTTARCILGAFACAILVSMSLSIAGVISWLDFFYHCSYVKLTITFIKYVPQAYFNYRRKSTEGWSIGNILLDFTGGLLSILQMVLNGYNYNDWGSFFGDITKVGLGLFSLSFDILFILQHYVFYRESHSTDFVRVNSSDEGSDMASSSEGKDFFLLVDNWHANEKTYDLDVKA